MAKRMTDSRKWSDPWFRRLPTAIKCFWVFVLDECDHAGIWKEDFEHASYMIGQPVTREAVLAALGGRVVRLSDEKLFIPGFIRYQYGNLNPANRAHLSVIQLLEQSGISPTELAPSKPLPRGIQGDKDKDKDKEKDNVLEGGTGGTYAPGFGYVAPAHVTREGVAECMAEWRKTLEHFGIDRPMGERDQIEIARAIQTYGADWVLLAMQGARKQKASPRFDPKNFVSLRIYLHRDRIERLVNIGAGKESADGVDWGKVFAAGGAA
jgi:hypothetical protein